MNNFRRTVGFLVAALVLLSTGPGNAEELKYRARKRLCSDVVCPLENELRAFFFPSSFTDLTNQVAGSEVISDALEVNGFEGSARIWVEGDESALLRVNGGEWKTMVDAMSGNLIEMKMTAPSVPGRRVSAMAKVGTKSAGWSVTTMGGPVVTFSAPFGDSLDQLVSTNVFSNEVTVTYSGEVQTANVSGGQNACLIVNWVGGCLASQQVSSGDTLQLRVRTASTPGTSSTVRLTVGASYADWFVKTAGEASVAYSSTFAPLSGQLENDLVSSNSVTVIGGVEGSVSAVTSGDGSPKFSINGGAWVAQGSVTSGDVLSLRMTTAPVENTARTATLTTGGVATVWTVETGSPTVVFSADFTDLSGQDRNIVVTSADVTVSGFSGSLTATAEGEGNPLLSVNGGPWVASASVVDGDAVALQVTSPSFGGTTGIARITVGSSFQDWSVSTVSTSGSCNVLPSWSSVQSELVSSRDAGVSGPVTMRAIPGYSGFIAATVAANGKLYAAPYTASGIMEIDPEAGTTSKFGSVGGSVAYMGGVLAPNCLIYLTPYGAGNIVELDPDAKITTTFGSVGSGRYWGSVLGRDGRIYVFPAFFSANSILKVDPESHAIEMKNVGNGFSEGVLSSTGVIYSFPYYGSTKILKYNPSTDTATTIDTNKTKTYGWAAGVVAPNGKIYSCPSMEANIIELNPSNDAISYIPLPSGAVGNYYGWEACALAPNGKIYLAPTYRGPGILELDPETRTVTVIDIPADLPQYGWEGMTLAPNGKLYAIPRFTDKVLEIDVHANRMWGGGIEKSAYFNKGGN